jgi:hypothetical protein
MCNDTELIVGYVYGELDGADRRRVEAHLAACGACRAEVTALQATRGHLASWTPPQMDLGFRIVRSDAPAAPPARRAWFAPAWGLAAAAVLVLAAAAAIANVEIRYDASGLVVRTGWARDMAAPQNAGGGAAFVQTGGADAWKADIAALRTRLGELERASRESAAATPAAAGPRLTDAEILRRVGEMVGRSETRQQREFALQIAQLVRDIDRARQIDLARIQQGLGQQRAATAAEVASQVNYYLRKVSLEK